MNTRETTCTLPVGGMSCGSCSARLQRTLAMLEGVRHAGVNLATARATITGTLPLQTLVEAIQDAGFTVPEIQADFMLKGLSCASCVKRAETAFLHLPGVRDARVNLANGEVHLRYIPESVDFTHMRQAVQALGFDLLPASEEEAPEERAEQERQQSYRDIRTRLGYGIVLLGGTLLLDHGALFGVEEILALPTRINHLLQCLLTTPLQFWVGWYFHRHTLLLARHGSANMHTLVTVGTFSAYFYSLLALAKPELFETAGMAPHVYFETSGAIIVLILLGRFLEARAKGHTSQAIRRLIGQTPKTARVMRSVPPSEKEGPDAPEMEEVEIPLSQVLPGDRVLVRPGEKVPVDGIILEGGSSIDESMMTGESMPVDRGPGETVMGGTLNGRGTFTCTATQVGRDTVLAHIVALVRQAQGAKPPIAHLADRIAAVFVPVVLVIATLTAVVWWIWGPEPVVTHALLNAVSVLIIACPCALGLATPTSIMVGTGKGAEQGILLRGSAALETAHRLNWVVFDKTGTLTEGKPRLTDWTGTPEDLAWVASAEYPSEHPVALAIVAYAKQEKCPLVTPDFFEALPGQGVRARCAERDIVVGTQRLMAASHIDTTALRVTLETLEQAGKTAMLAAVDGRAVGVLAVADTVRPESRAAIAALHKAGIQVALLTGDNRRTAQAMADPLQIQHILAEVLPGDKADEIARLQGLGNVVAMVGDGINDAPALARADVGMAMGGGTDVAMEAADITLMRSDPRGVVAAIQLSRATMTNIRQNLFWAFAYNVVLIPLAAGVWYPAFGLQLSPIFAAAAMGLSSVTVVGNALRLRGFKPVS